MNYREIDVSFVSPLGEELRTRPQDTKFRIEGSPSAGKAWLVHGEGYVKLTFLPPPRRKPKESDEDHLRRVEKWAA